MTAEKSGRNDEQATYSISNDQTVLEDQDDDMEYQIKEINDLGHELDRINKFFNQKQIKREIHWFTHRDTLERAVEWKDRSLFYVELDQSIVGGVMVWCRSRVLPKGVAQIRLIAVDPEYRGRGIGQALITKAMRFANTHDQSTMRADVAAESPAVEFWKNLGFKISDEYQTSGRRTMYETRRPITVSKK